MGSGDTVTLTLKGGAPWGFRLQGGGPHPLQVSKIRKKSKAHAQGMQEGDKVISVNGVSVSGRSHDETMQLVDMSGDLLAIELFKGNMPDVYTVAGTHGALINGHTTMEQDGGCTTTTTSTSYDDGRTKGSVETQTCVEKGDGRESHSFVHKERMTSVVQDQWAPTQAPLPSLLDTSLSKQPYSSQPVQVQVSAMFSGPQGGVQENSTPQVQAAPKPGNVQMFNVRKVTTTKDTWQPGDTSRNQGPQTQFTMPDDKDFYPAFPLPESKKWGPTGKQPPPTPPKPAPKPTPSGQHEIPIMRVRDVKTQLMSPRSYDDGDEDSFYSSRDESVMSGKHHRLPVFAPPVQISLHAGERDDLSDRPNDLDLVRTMSIESEISSPTSSQGGRSRKLFGDSAFYDDPEKHYPTIRDQMKLCQIIAHSLTSAANRKARGAKMFAKRQRKSERWIHDGHLQMFSIDDDIPGCNPHYYDDDGSDRFRLHFKVPNVKHRITSPDTVSKMSLTQQEFERMRFEAERCDHQSVSPNQCFEIAQSLKHSKGKAGNMFEKRRQRSEKYVVDESNAQKTPIRLGTKLGGSRKPLKGTLSPWEAALVDPCGSVERAFEQLSEFERKQKLNQMLKLKPMAAPIPPSVSAPFVISSSIQHASLRADPQDLLHGQNFNRKAKGWGVSVEPSPASYPHPSGSSTPVHVSQPHQQEQQQQQQYQQQQQCQQQSLTPQVRDFNPKPKAWRSSEEFEPQYQVYSSPYASDSSNIMSPSGYRNPPTWGQPASAMPGTDL